MIPALNYILFFFTSLFGIEQHFVAEQTFLTVDFQTRSVSIEYSDLKVQKEEVDVAKVNLAKVEGANSFHNAFADFKLTSKSINLDNGMLNSVVEFQFQNEAELIELLRFNKDHYGNSSPSDGLYYHLLPSERLRSTSGEISNSEEGQIIRWPKKTSSIQLKISRSDADSYWSEKDMVSGAKLRE